MVNKEGHEASFSAHRYRTPDGAPADIVIFTIVSETSNRSTKSLPRRELKVLLIKRRGWPFEGAWALPGGFSQATESMYDTARRELSEETGIEGVHMEYFNVYSKPGRDPRGWILSHAFFALVQEDQLTQRKASDDAVDVGLFNVDKLGSGSVELAFDHKQIIEDALEQIRSKMLLTPIAKEFLPEEFTLSQLYQVIQTVVPDFEEVNFIRKMNSTQSRSGVLEEVKDEKGNLKKSNEFSQRAAQLYRFTGTMPRLSIYR